MRLKELFGFFRQAGDLGMFRDAFAFRQNIVLNAEFIRQDVQEIFPVGQRQIRGTLLLMRQGSRHALKDRMPGLLHSE
jgi:hypothetical protein